MDSNCFQSQVPFENASFIASKVLSENIPTLSERHEVYLDRLTDRLCGCENEQVQDDDGEKSLEEEVDSESEGVDEDDTEELDYDFLLDSTTVLDEAPFNISDFFPLRARGSSPAAAAKRKSNRRKSRAKRARTSTVYIVGRVTPENPTKNDKNQYRVITLSNGLRAALIRTPHNPENVENEDLNFFMDTLNVAIKEREKRGRQKCLPTNFPAGFPLADLPMAQAVTKIIEHEMGKHGGGNNRETNVSLPKTTVFSAADVGNLKSKAKLEASIAVTVNVGACDDPYDCAGLAHFTEHMVHYGSKKYPGEEEYFSAAINYGHGFNAFTENHTTTYYNTVPLTHVNKFMDRMADMLTFPTFEQSMTLREVNSVDAEFNLSRHYDILNRRHLFGHAIQGHPLGKFDCGTVETLLTPKNIHKTLRSFHSKYYVASAMTACLASNLPLAVQEKLVLKNFSNLSEGRRGIYLETPPTAEEQKIVGDKFNMDYIMQGKSSLSNLWLVWPIPEAFVHNRSNKSLSIFLKLLGADGPGSLTHYLNKIRGYIWLMLCSKSQPYSDPFLMENKYTTFVTIDYFLTSEGEAHVEDIMLATFTYFHELGKLGDAMFLHAFNEMKGQEELHSKVHASPISLSKTLQTVEPENLLKNDNFFWKDAVYNPLEIRTIMKHLTATNMMIIQTLSNKTKLRSYIKSKQIFIEPFGETEFVVQRINNRFGKLMSSSNDWSNRKYNFAFYASSINLHTLLVPCQYCGTIKRQELECMLCTLQIGISFGDKVFRAIHFGDDPGNYKSACIINYINNDAMYTPRQFAMSLIWTTSVYLNIRNEFESDSSETGIVLNVHPYGITIGLVGFLNKLEQQIATINEEFFLHPVEEDSFKKAQTALLTVYDMMFAHNAEFIIEELLHFMSCNHSGEVLSDALTHIHDLSAKEVSNFTTTFKSKAMGVAIFGGNVSIQSALDVVKIINEQDKDYSSYFNFSLIRFTISELLRPKTCYSYKKDMKMGEKCVRVKTDLSYSYTTTVINFYYVGRYNPAEYLLWMNSLFYFGLQSFLNLRTKKQLGYHVASYFPKPEPGLPIVIGVGVTSTARKFSPCELDKHLDDWMVEYGRFLKTVDENKFKNLKKHRGIKGNALDVKMSTAREWYAKYFGPAFATNRPNKFQSLGICKISVQVVGNDSKLCNCEKCNAIADWRTADIWKHLQFVWGNAPFEDYFVNNPKKIRDD